MSLLKQLLGEKWAHEYKVPEEKKGMFKGKTKAKLESELAVLKKSGPHKEGSTEYKKEKELNFAIRAKSGWPKGESVEENKESQQLDEAGGSMVTLRIESESEKGTEFITIPKVTADEIKLLLQKAQKEGEWPDKVNKLLKTGKKVPVYGTVNTMGDGWGWYK